MKRFLLRTTICTISMLLGTSAAWSTLINMSNLYDPNITCYYGQYDYPYASTGVVTGRHTIMTSGYDPIVGSSLTTVPAGETSAIRLGNSSTGSQAEAISFRIVPTSDEPILLLRYAAVMENPGHSAYEQPKIKLEVMNANMQAISSGCLSFEFISNDNLVGYGPNDWHRCTNNNSILWKNWTNVGVDFSDHLGETIYVRLTNYDCNQGGHFGYCYIHLSSMPKKLTSDACGNTTSTVFSAPSGFEYQWYEDKGGVRTPKGTTQSITVAIDTNNVASYSCDINPVGKGKECSFSMSIEAKPRFPISKFSIKKVNNCNDIIYLTNESGVSYDGKHMNEPREDCDIAVWDLGDGRKLTTYDLSTTPITYKHSGTYTISLLASLGDGSCSHTTSQTVHIYGTDDPRRSEMTATICEGDYFPLNGQKFFTSGLHETYLKTETGCDSVSAVNITVNPSYLFTDTMYVCDYEPFTWRKKTFQVPDIYYDSLITKHTQCDSVYKLVALPILVQYSRDTIYFKEGETINANGREISQDTVLYDLIKSSKGCDSIRHTYVYKRIPYHFLEVATICDNETYQWRGQTYSQNKHYYDNFTTIYGTDSIYELQLNVLPTYLKKTKVQVCSDQTYRWRNNKLLAATGTYYDSLLTQTGCDSVYVIEFTQAPVQRTIIHEDICEGDYYDYKGQHWHTSGVHYDSLKTSCGCDSIIEVELTVHKKQHYHEAVVITEGDTYTWRGKQYTKGGIYQDKLKSNWGCDSIFELKVTVCYPFEHIRTASICDYEHFIWRGNSYNQTGTYTDQQNSVLGCDSTYILNLTVHPTLHNHTTDSICDPTYSWRGMKLTRSGFYADTTYNPEQGQCEINSIYLTIKQETFLTQTLVEEVCANDQEFEIQYIYHGETPIIYNVLFDATAKAAGFKDIHDQVVNGPIMVALPQPHNLAYLHPDTYHGTLVLTNGVCDGQHNSQPFMVTVHYPSWIIQQNWDDVVALLNEQNNGGYRFSNYLWNVNGRDINYGNHPNLYFPNLQMGDLVSLYLTREGEDYAISTCPIVIEPFTQTRSGAIIVSMNHHRMTIQSKEDGEYCLLDMFGNLITRGTFDHGISNFDLPTLSGCYMIQIKTSTEEYVKKLIMQ